jgi:hypothetical protein
LVFLAISVIACIIGAASDHSFMRDFMCGTGTTKTDAECESYRAFKTTFRSYDLRGWYIHLLDRYCYLAMVFPYNPTLLSISA